MQHVFVSGRGIRWIQGYVKPTRLECTQGRDDLGCALLEHEGDWNILVSAMSQDGASDAVRGAIELIIAVLIFLGADGDPIRVRPRHGLEAS